MSDHARPMSFQEPQEAPRLDELPALERARLYLELAIDVAEGMARRAATQGGLWPVNVNEPRELGPLLQHLHRVDAALEEAALV